MKKSVDIIRTFPDSILKVKTKSIKDISDAVINTLKGMTKIVKTVEGAGLAANQIGIGRSLAVALIDNAQFLELINPIVKEMEGEEFDDEGCLSIPNTVIKVPRAKRIVIEYLDINENTKIFEAKGFTARVLQHEIDHLNGILIIDKLNPEKKLKFLRAYKK